MRRSLAIILVFGIIALQAAGSEDKVYTYVWSPRADDVGSAGSSDYVLLEALLKLSKPVDYVVAPGDSLDYIIRKEFLISQRYKHAFELYLHRIDELNPNLRKERNLRPGRTIRLPGGPKYGGTELATMMLPRHIREKAFREMSQKAYGLAIATEEKIQHYATQSLGAYVSPTLGGNRAKLFQAIEERGLVYPIDLTKHPEAELKQVQILTLVANDEITRLAVKTVVGADSRHLLPGMFPMSAPTPVDCTPPCTTCAGSLHLPNGLDLTKSRVLIEDTGVKPGSIDSDHLIQVRPDDNGSDMSPQFHGTFVYSEIAAPASSAAASVFGAVPRESIYVARTVQDVTGTQYFSMSDIMTGWKKFSTLMNNDSSAAKTWVVNVSAFGEPVPDPDHIPAIPNDNHLLIVAAAGNDGKEDEPALEAFPRLSNGNTPLLIVGALDKNGKPAKYSNWNSLYVHLFAPGDCVCGAPGQIDGTSQATPFVATAAAVVAAANPNWNPKYVMWRLLATADHPSDLQGKAFAGTVNLSRALEPAIIVEETSLGGSTKTHHATSIKYDLGWKTAFAQLGINILNKETLRLYSPTAGAIANKTCFAALQNLYPEVKQLCVDSENVVTIYEDGSWLQLKADQVSEIILPMPNDDGSHLPDVFVGSNQ